MVAAMPPANASEPRAISDSGVIIVGGTAGIGRAAAGAFIDAGVPRLVLIGRDQDRGRSVRDELRAAAAHARIEFVAADVRGPDQALRAATDARGHLDTVDVLINATGAAQLPALLHHTPVEQVPAVLADLVLPPLLMTRIVLGWMREQSSGCIINVASDAAKVPTPGESVIGAAMSAIVSFSRTLALEAKRDGIRVNVLTPSLVGGTPTAERLFADTFSARLFGKARELAHLGVSTAEDQAALMLFLAGPHAHRLTGQAISVNGGISAA